MGYYLNPELVKKESEKECKGRSDQCVRVTCFYNGLYLTCPHPYDRDLVNRMFQQIDYYLTPEYFFVRANFLTNKKNWNPPPSAN